jgi:cytochrome c-type biogenesis protein CcmH/NrfG
VQPYAASPLLQRALVLELQHRFGAGAVEARQATTAEPGNWRAWVVLSRIEAEAGNVPASVAAFTRARALDPHSPLFRAAR